MRLYVIRYEWPKGKVRYRCDAGLVSTADEADQYTWADSKLILELAKDARMVWGIVATMQKAPS